MKFKPKEVQVNLPTVLTFASEDEIVEMASAFNNFIHGKVKMKYEVLGLLGGQHVGLFYMQRNSESQQLRDEFMAAINQEEEETYSSKPTKREPQPKNCTDLDEELSVLYDHDNSSFGGEPFRIRNCWKPRK